MPSIRRCRLHPTPSSPAPQPCAQEVEVHWLDEVFVEAGFPRLGAGVVAAVAAHCQRRGQPGMRAWSARDGRLRSRPCRKGRYPAVPLRVRTRRRRRGSEGSALFVAAPVSKYRHAARSFVVIHNQNPAPQFQGRLARGAAVARRSDPKELPPHDVAAFAERGKPAAM